MKQRIRSTHIHDNNGTDDKHLFPTVHEQGTIDWKAVMPLLASRPSSIPMLLELKEDPENRASAGCGDADLRTSGRADRQRNRI